MSLGFAAVAEGSALPVFQAPVVTGRGKSSTFSQAKKRAGWGRWAGPPATSPGVGPGYLGLTALGSKLPAASRVSLSVLRRKIKASFRGVPAPP